MIKLHPTTNTEELKKIWMIKQQKVFTTHNLNLILSLIPKE